MLGCARVELTGGLAPVLAGAPGCPRAGGPFSYSWDILGPQALIRLCVLWPEGALEL